MPSSDRSNDSANPTRKTQAASGLSYADAGVNIDAGNALVKRIAGHAAATRRPESLGGLGGFAALTAIPAGYREPILVSGTDGVGTKLKLAFTYDRHEYIGQDLVAMVVNDLLVTGAEPLFFLDYYATGALDVDVAERVIAGIANACRLAGCSLAGGETAEMPGFYQAGEYDVAGFCVGVVEKSEIVDGSTIVAGNQLIGLPSSGPHSNGYSLIRKILETQGAAPDGTLREALLAPTRIYVSAVRAVLARHAIAGMAHITGGGITENAPRMLPSSATDLLLAIDIDAWQRPDVFSWLSQAGNLAEAELLRTFNCGIGFVLCVAPDLVEPVLAALKAEDEHPIMIGEVIARSARGQFSNHLLLDRDGAID